jgi:hypothetical protein
MVTGTEVEPCGVFVCPGSVLPGFVVDDELESDPVDFVSSVGLTILQPLSAVSATRESAANVILALNLFIRSPPTRTERAGLHSLFALLQKTVAEYYTLFLIFMQVHM